MKNLSISKKLYSTFTVVILLFLVTVVSGLASIFVLRSNYENFYLNDHTVATQVATADSTLRSVSEYLSYAVIAEDPEQASDYIDQASSSYAEFDNSLTWFRNNLQIQEDISILNSLTATLNEANSSYEEITTLAVSSSSVDKSRAQELIVNEYAPLLEEADSLLNQLGNNTVNEAASSYAFTLRTSTISIVFIIVFSIAAIIVTILLSLVLLKNLLLPIQEIKKALSDMENGHLSVSIAYTSKDELGQLADSIRSMSERISYYMNAISDSMSLLASGNLNVHHYPDFLGDFQKVQLSIRRLIDTLDSTLYQINQSADQVASGADQISSGAQALSQGSTEQASSVEELAATSNDISHQLQETAQNAQEVKSQVTTVGEDMTACNEDMKELSRNMDDIYEKSRAIDQILKTIEDITSQTNILALNAAVEAARAGTYGKGFAVVADEVRNLARKSQEASKESSALIASSNKAIERGKAITDAAAERLDKTVKSALGVTDLIMKIVDSTSAGSDAVTQVTQGIDQISSVVQTNSATAQENAAASEELSGQSQMLKSLVGQFQLTSKAGELSMARHNDVPSTPDMAAPSSSSDYDFDFSSDKY